MRYEGECKMEKLRHGDVLVSRVEKLPEAAKEKKGLTLAEGEVTGHSHQISEGSAQMFLHDSKTYLKVLSDVAKLTHEEHAALSIPKGVYEIQIQREYSPEGWKYVAD